MRKYRGIRYAFWPASYWDDPDPLSAVLRNVTGENRRQMITDFWKSGQLEELSPELLCDEPDRGTVTRLGGIHPSFLGGEFLPPCLPGEVEIARICLRSTTSDVISLRARPVLSGIAYRIEDEYRGKFTLPIAVSERPLTLAEIITQFEEGHLEQLDWPGGLALGYNNMNVEFSELERLRHFTRITSRIYRQLEDHFEHVFDEWFAESLAERDASSREG